MSRMVIAIITAGRNCSIDSNVGEACDVVSNVFTHTKIALTQSWQHVGDGAYDHNNHMKTRLKGELTD